VDRAQRRADLRVERAGEPIRSGILTGCPSSEDPDEQQVENTRDDSTATAVALTAALRRLRARLRRESPPGLAELTMPQALALARIVEEGPISNAALAAGEYIRPQSMHEMVQLPESRGFVRRGVDPADRRRLLIEVTRRGRRVVNELMELRHQWLARAIERDLTLAEGELLAIAAGLMRRIAASEDDGPPPAGPLAT
jgi:DNA-binding MarR family transcriptional regulator